MLELKDAFFCIPLDKWAQSLFAFKWQDPKPRVTFQYFWTTLPQGFKNSPTIFNEILARDLHVLHLTKGVLLQYVDDLLIASPTSKTYQSNTILVLSHLARCGYNVSPQKVQVCKQEVTSLSFQLRQGIKSLMSGRKKINSSYASP